ncbi:uncharacterized protein LOC124133799 [Haliotis rufescens]|uniref:uncharacterized protein LOC124133799 n=1 Tax=Haliotis rufescens TaxID=6454 RepID=UPI00201E8C9D|nr:uncharacterized protein LOC124133799 [Haliotis rufescens]
MFGSRDARLLKCWIYLCSVITLVSPTGILEIRFDRFQAVNTGQNTADPNAGGSSTTVSMATTQSLENLSSNSTPTPIVPVTPSWEDPPVCQPPTRYRFLLCMDMLGQPEQCSLGREETEMLQITQGTVTPTGEGSDILMFGNNLRGMPNPQVNPLRYNFPTWPGSISVTAYVQCCGVPDPSRCEEKLSGRMSVIPSVNQRTAVPTLVNVTNKGSLMLSVTILCSPNYYGVNCSTFCRDDNQLDNRVCHPTTGQLVCSPGWSGRNCNEDVNECDLGVCRHSAGCNNLLGTFTCHCLRGSSGRFCENREASCSSQPCLNGGTCFEDLASVGFLCECAPSWSGAQCATLVPRTTLGPPTGHVTGTVASEQDDPKTEPQSSSDWTLWYVVIALLAVTCLVVIILIICVIWSSRKRRYQISGATKPDQAIATVTTVTTAPPPGQFDNMVYLHDPEDLDLQPPTSNLYQRALMSDDPYINQASLYEDRIDPDTPFEGEGQDVPRGSGRPVSSATDNFYASWDCILQPEDSQYEAITFQGFQERLDGLQRSQAGTSPSYRRGSDPASDSNFYPTHPGLYPVDFIQSDTSEMVASQPNNDRRLSTFRPVPESQISGQFTEPIYDRRLSVEPTNEDVAQSDQRFSSVSQTVQADRRMSTECVNEDTKVTGPRVVTLTNPSVSSSFKRPCPTPRASRTIAKEAHTESNSEMSSTPQLSSRKNSEIPSAPHQSNRKNSEIPSAPHQSNRKNSEIPSAAQQGKRKNSADLLNQIGGLLQDGPAENSRSKSGSYALSK